VFADISFNYESKPAQLRNPIKIIIPGRLGHVFNAVEMAAVFAGSQILPWLRLSYHSWQVLKD